MSEQKPTNNPAMGYTIYTSNPLNAPQGGIAQPDVYEAYRKMADERQKKRTELRTSVATERNMFVAILLILLSVVFADVLLRSPGGFGATVCFLLYEAILFYLYKNNEGQNLKKALLLAVPVILISLSFSLFQTKAGYFIPYVTMIVLLMMQVILLSGSKLTEAFSPQMIPELLTRTIGKPIENLDLYFAAYRVPKDRKSAKIKNLLFVVLGIVVAVPFAALLLSLFLSADAVFAEGYKNFIDALKIDLSLPRIMTDVIIGGMIAIFLGSVLIYNTTSSRTEVKTAKTVRLNTIVGLTFAIILNVVVFAFAFVQIRYLFFTNSYHAIIEEIGYAEYARRGFFELSWASGIVFAVAAAVLGLCRKDGKNPLAIRISVLLMCLGNIVVALSSARRMQLYIDAHGFSIRRISTLFGIAVILVSLMWLAIKCAAPKLKSLKMIGVSMVILVTMFSFLNVDRIVSSYNAPRYISGELEPDMEYFNQLSYTATGDLVALYEDAKNNPGGYTEEQIEQMQIALVKKKTSYDERTLLSYTIDDIAVKKAFDRLPEDFFEKLSEKVTNAARYNDYYWY